MATLMIVGNSEEKRRCDAKCYNAKHPKCECCCGGRNHGIGLKQALENNADWCIEQAREAGKEGLVKELISMKEDIHQMSLFDLEEVLK